MTDQTAGPSHQKTQFASLLMPAAFPTPEASPLIQQIPKREEFSELQPHFAVPEHQQPWIYTNPAQFHPHMFSAFHPPQQQQPLMYAPVRRQPEIRYPSPASSRPISPQDVESISQFAELVETPGEPTRFKCSHEGCGKEFTRLYNLRNHFKLHTGEALYSCSECNARFTRRHDLIRHTRLHTKEKPFECPYCGRRFSRSDARSRHIKVNACSMYLNSKEFLIQRKMDQMGQFF